MQPFHVKQIWTKKKEEPVKKIEKKELKEGSSSSSTEPAQVVPLPNWEDMFPKDWEMLRHISMNKKREDYPSNPYRYNLQRSVPITSLGPSPL